MYLNRENAKKKKKKFLVFSNNVKDILWISKMLHLSLLISKLCQKYPTGQIWLNFHQQYFSNAYRFIKTTIKFCFFLLFLSFTFYSSSLDPLTLLSPRIAKITVVLTTTITHVSPSKNPKTPMPRSPQPITLALPAC